MAINYKSDSTILPPLILRKLFWVRDILGGGGLYKEYRKVKKFMKNGNIQREVERILKYASENVPFYRYINSTQLSDFPVVNKQTYLEYYNKFIVPLERIKVQKGNLHIQSTSGSTGIPFKVPQDTKCRLRRLSIIKCENENLGFNTCDPMLHLRSISHHWSESMKLYNKQNNIWYRDNSDLTEKKILEIIDLIRRKKIKFIRGYMTTLELITRYAVENKIEFKHKPFFISVGELLNPNLRENIVENLGCKMVSQYGNEENGIFGTSPINGNGRTIILNNAATIIEILKIEQDIPVTKPNEVGRIVVTDYSNRSFPMIRYDIGDLASIGTIDENKIITQINNLSGRKTDLILKPNGQYLDIYATMPHDIYGNTKIKQWQFIQTGKYSYTLKLNIDKKASSLDFENSINIIQKVLGNEAKLNVEIVENLPVLKSGKFKSVINEWQNQN